MITLLGKSLIRNHEHELFKQFFISIRFKIDSESVQKFVIECLENYAVECLLPIFALCGQNFTIQADLLKSSSKVVRIKDCDTKVTLEQINSTERVKQAMIKDYKNLDTKKVTALNVTHFIENVSTDLVD